MGSIPSKWRQKKRKPRGKARGNDEYDPEENNGTSSSSSGKNKERKRNSQQHEVGTRPIEMQAEEGDHYSDPERKPEDDENNKENEDTEDKEDNEDEEHEEGEEDKDENDKDEKDEDEKDEDEKNNQTENEEIEEEKDDNEETEEDNAADGDDNEEEEEYKTWDGKLVKVEYSGVKLKALRGNMNIEYPEKTQIVRIFTSSTFTDTSVERNTLMETVFPKLKAFCQKKGFEFQVVDMRWGVRDEATDDHMTTELCMKELYACQKLSTGPNFITFLGQKYGYRPFPPRIKDSEFTQLMKAIENDEREILDKWFKLDTNALPNEYVLQPVTSFLPDYRNQSNPDLKKAASSEWWSCFESMQMALRKAAIKVLNKNEQQKYIMSVTEDEIRRGVMKAASPEKHCFWFKRVISDLNDNIADRKAGSFVDKVWGKDYVDEEAQRYLSNLREVDLPKVLSEKNINVYDVKWNKNGIDPEQEPTHDDYIKNLCHDFYSVLTKMIEDGIKEKTDKESNNEEVFEEVFQHGIFSQKKCKTFEGRRPFLEEIKTFFENGSTTLILHGKSGCGKTSVMAKVASSVKSWIGDPKATLVLRFIGTTANSFAIRDLLKSICTQLCKATGHQADEIPEDLKSLKEHLNECLEKAAEKHPVILMLDSLDQLSADDGGLQLEWLPKSLPSDVHMIVSTLPEEEYICLPKLKMHFPEECFKAIPKMSKEEAGDILDKWLKDAKRSLTSQQRDILLSSFNGCPLPLFLKLAFDEACRWKSYTPATETTLPSTIPGIIHSLFDRLERIHGRTLVSHSLAYISGSKNGLMESELEDLLSLDDDVLNDVYQYWTPPIRRLPPLIWLRVRNDLGDYLVERGLEGARVSFWYHRQFIEVSAERYLQKPMSIKIHSSIAEYFQGVWSDGKKKPFVSKQGQHHEMDRIVAQQPLKYDANEDSLVFNKRKLAELPYQLVKSKQPQELKEMTLCNYEFLLAKLRAMSYNVVMDDFRIAVNEFPDDEELKLLYDTIGLATSGLKLDPKQLSSQLIGRLFQMRGDSSLSSTKPYIAKLLEQLQFSSVPYFVPHKQCLSSSGGPLLYAIAEHNEESSIDSICLSHDNSKIVTTARGSEGLEIRLFNIRAGVLERKLILTEPIPEVFMIWHTILSNLGQLVMIGGRKILVLDLKKGEIVHEIEALSEDLTFQQTGYELPPVALGNVHSCIAALTDTGVKIWNMETGKQEHNIPVQGVDASGSMGALDASNDYVAFCKKNSNEITVIGISNGETAKTIQASFDKSNESHVKFIRLTNHEKLIVLSSDAKELKIYDVQSGNLVKNVEGFSINTTVKELIITNDEKKLVCQDKYDLAIWDMESWKCRKVLNDMAHLHSPNIKTNDGKIVVHANMVDRIVRIYDASKDEAKESVAAPDSANQWVINQINALYPSNDGRHFVTVGTANMTTQIEIWDIKRRKQVRVFRNLMFYPSVLRMLSASVGVAYIYNEKMYHYVVLDFATGKVQRHLEGKACKRMHMIEFLENDRMISFSRGRRHLKIWNILTGKAVELIKLHQQHRLEAFLISGNKKIIVIAQAGTYSGEMTDDTIPLIVYDFSSRKHHEIRETNEQLKLESTGWSVNASISHSGRYLVNVQGYVSATLWDVVEGRRKHSITSEQVAGAIYSCSILENKNIFLTSHTGKKNGVFIWNISNGECVGDISTITAVNDIKVSVNEQLVFWKDMQGPNFFVNELENGKSIATFTLDQPIAPQTFNVIDDNVIAGVTGSTEPVIFYLRQAEPDGNSMNPGPSLFEDGGDIFWHFDYDPNTLPPDPRDVDDDDDDDDGQAC